jgi:DNA-binding NtrC family response regulator
MNYSLVGKKILAVDDELDILETLTEILDICDVDTASDFESAKKMLINNHYDAAILDIMGVNGYDLLNLAKVKSIPALMLTAHALSPEHLEKSIGGGACCYLPKEEMVNIADHLCDVLMAKALNSQKPYKWFERLEPCFERKWGAKWKNNRMETLQQLNLVHTKDELEKIL